MQDDVSHSRSAFATTFGGMLGCVAAVCVVSILSIIMVCGGCALLMQAPPHNQSTYHGSSR